MTLAIAKRDTVDRLLSKALTDNQITDGEFQLLMAEFSQYNVLKDAVPTKLTHQSSRPDVEKIKKDVRSEMEAEFRKKITANSGLHFSVTKSHARRCVTRHGKKKTQGEGARWLYVCLVPARSSPSLTRLASTS